MTQVGSIERSATLKRIFDILASGIGIVALLPVYALVALAVAFDSPGPIIFRQLRLGKNESPFYILKFRTMRHDGEGSGRLITTRDDPRITRVGRILRKWKLDELPQLINVVCGDMSMVGPRPEVPKFIDCLSPEQRELLFSVKPGITDLAALEYRNEEVILAGSDQPESLYVDVILPAKFALYQQYIRERNFWLDLKLIFRTLWQLVGVPRT